MLIDLECKLLNKHAKVPTKTNPTDAGHDLYACESVILQPRSLTNVATGIALACPKGFYYTIEGRSGLGKRGVLPFRGIIDAGYTGQVMVMLHNLTDELYQVNVGDRIAQICVHQLNELSIAVVDDFSVNYNHRGTAGFGSSGK